MKEPLDFAGPRRTGVPNRWVWAAVVAALFLVGAGVILPKYL